MYTKVDDFHPTKIGNPGTNINGLTMTLEEENSLFCWAKCALHCLCSGASQADANFEPSETERQEGKGRLTKL